MSRKNRPLAGVLVIAVATPACLPAGQAGFGQLDRVVNLGDLSLPERLLFPDNLNDGLLLRQGALDHAGGPGVANRGGLGRSHFPLSEILRKDRAPVKAFTDTFRLPSYILSRQ